MRTLYLGRATVMDEPEADSPLGGTCRMIQQDDIHGLNATLCRDPSLIFEKDTKGNTALHYCVKRRNLEAAKTLCAHGIDSGVVNDNGYTAATAAAAIPDAAFVRELMVQSRKYAGKRQKMESMREALLTARSQDEPPSESHRKIDSQILFRASSFARKLPDSADYPPLTDRSFDDATLDPDTIACPRPSASSEDYYHSSEPSTVHKVTPSVDANQWNRRFNDQHMRIQKRFHNATQGRYNYREIADKRLAEVASHADTIKTSQQSSARSNHLIARTPPEILNPKAEPLSCKLLPTKG
jgi:hypothetical protein